MKTVMTQLVEFLNKLNTDSSEPPNLERRLLQRWCENLLKAEKEQIWMAFNDGKVSAIVKNQRTPEEYYNLTFKSDE